MSYLGAATSVIGGELQGWAALLDKQAQAQAFQDELARQSGFRKEGTGIMEQGILGASREQSDIDRAAGRTQRMADYTRLGAVPLGFGMPNRATAGTDRAYSNMQGAARANLGSYSDWQLQQMIRQLQTQQALGKVSSFAKGDASVFPYQMYEAAHSADDLAMIGSAISSIGGGAANWAQYGQGPQIQQPSQFGGYGTNLLPNYNFNQTQPMNPYADTLYGGIIG